MLRCLLLLLVADGAIITPLADVATLLPHAADAATLHIHDVFTMLPPPPCHDIAAMLYAYAIDAACYAIFADAAMLRLLHAPHS